MTKKPDTCTMIFKDVPKDIRNRFKTTCIYADVSMKAIVIEFIRTSDAGLVEEMRDKINGRTANE